MAGGLVEIKGPGGLVKVAEKDVNRYLRRPGFDLAGRSDPKKLSDADAAEAKKKADAAAEKEKKDSAAALKGKKDKKTASDLAEAAAKDKAGFDALLEDVRKATTPELEMIVDEYNLGLTLSRINLVADRRVAVTRALQAKMKKG